jgi:hypothetical protein
MKLVAVIIIIIDEHFIFNSTILPDNDDVNFPNCWVFLAGYHRN